MSYDQIKKLTFPQAYQFSRQLMETYKEQNRNAESARLQAAINRMRHGR